MCGKPAGEMRMGRVVRSPVVVVVLEVEAGLLQLVVEGRRIKRW